MFLPHLLTAPRVHPSVFLASGVSILGDVSLDEDCTVWFNSVIRGDVAAIRIGKRCNVQDMCMIHATLNTSMTELGHDVSIGHRVTLHGCRIHDRVLVGMGAVVMDNAIIGEDSLVGAGALVTVGTEIPPGSLVVGAPARVKRETTQKERELIRRTAANYIAYAGVYRQAGFVAQPPPQIWP